MTDEKIKEFFESHHWKFAATMPRLPHWYTLRRNARDDAEFAAVVEEIRKRGYTQWAVGREWCYLDVGDFKYWSCGAPVEETILINRTHIDPAKAKEAARVEIEKKKVAKPRAPAESHQQRMFADG